jgi:hydrogenase-4 component E
MNTSQASSDFGPALITLQAAAMLVIQFLMVGQRMLPAGIRLFAVQSFLLAGIAAVTAYSHHVPEVYLVAGLTLAGKVIVLPWFMLRLVRQVGIDQEHRPWLNAPSAMLLCGGLALLSYVVARPFATAEAAGAHTFGVSIALMLSGFFLMINRRRAITQVLALLCAENGVVLAAISLTVRGMPVVVELGVFFDLFIGIVVLSILVYRIRETFSSIDVDQLNRLKG